MKETLRIRKYTLIDTICIPFKLAPISASVQLLRYVLMGLLPTLTAVVTAQLVDSALTMLNDGASASVILNPIIFFVLITAYTILNNKIAVLPRTLMTNALRTKMRTALLEKTARLEYHCIENPESWDLIERINYPAEDKTPEDRMTTAFCDTFVFLSIIISAVSLVAFIMSQSWLSGIIIVCTAVPLVILSIRGGNKIHQAYIDTSDKQRRHKYLNEVLTGRDSALERSMFGFTEGFSEDCLNALEEARVAEYEARKKWFFSMNLTGLMTLAATGICSIFILIPTLSGAITVGVFAGIISAVTSFVGNMRWQLASSTLALTRNKNYCKDLTKFLELPECNGALEPPATNTEEFKELEFRNVTFAYPDSNVNVLDKMSFKLERGKHYSFVGANGAGKTTITKLILGLYDNYEGEILINGKDIKQYAMPELKALFACAFQDFARYQASMRENVELGNVNGTEPEVVKKAVTMAGLTDLTEKIGLDAHVGKLDSDGVDVSGGEWQRIAIARVIVNPAEVRILDEPTAALDPIAECAVYERFSNISKNHTTVFISHRLGSAKLASVIYVLDKGRVAEVGSHDELMKKGGLYAEMFESQRSWYI